MIPINTTHTAIVTHELHSLLLSPSSIPNLNLPKATTALRHLLSTLISFFAASYSSTFGFILGPPLHDALTIAYVTHPELFTCTRYRVDVELEGKFTAGETVVDMWRYQTCDETWGSTGRNCLVAETLNVRDIYRL
jgi:uridine nucleosidase